MNVTIRRYVVKVIQCVAILLITSGCVVIDKIHDATKLKISGKKISIDQNTEKYEPDPSLSSLSLREPESSCNKTLDFSSFSERNSFRFGYVKKFSLISMLIIHKDEFIVMDARGTIHSFSIKTKQKLWEIHFSGKSNKIHIFSAPQFLNGGIEYSDGIIYATAGSNEVKAFDVKSGKMIWSKALISPTRAQPVVAGDKLLIQTIDHNLYVLNKNNGEIIWFYSGISEAISVMNTVKPLVYGDYVLSQQENDEIFALDLSDGNIAWTISIDKLHIKPRSNHQIKAVQTNMLLDGDLAFFNTKDAVLVAADLKNKKIAWEKNLQIQKQLYVCGDLLYAIDQNDMLIAIFKYDGRIKWIQNLKKFGKEVASWTAPIIVNGKILVIDSFGKAMFFDALSGAVSAEKDQKLRFERDVSMSPIVFNNNLLTIHNDGRVIAYHGIASSD